MASGVVPQALGFVLSFTAIAVFWRLNVRLTRLFTRLDSVTAALNLVAAPCVIFLAFTTQGISDPKSFDLPLPTVAYVVNVALVSVCLVTMYEVARARWLLRHPTSRRQNTIDLLRGLIAAIVFVLSIPVTLLWGAIPGRWCWATLIVLSLVAGTLAARSATNDRVGSEHGQRTRLHVDQR